MEYGTMEVAGVTFTIRDIALRDGRFFLTGFHGEPVKGKRQKPRNLKVYGTDGSLIFEYVTTMGWAAALTVTIELPVVLTEVIGTGDETFWVEYV